jgi:UDP-N-acetylglucosamine 2-epimerase (non-hydrolysing)
MKIAFILGTRPEIIKLSSLLRLCNKEKIEHIIIHSNQHYSKDMDDIFFNELQLIKPKFNLGVGSGSHGNQTGKILIQTEEILEKEKPDIVLVQGDTNTVVAGALAASKLNIKVGHIEAGLRSYNRRMPEETNRTITDHISNFLFCPTDVQKEILLNEGIDKDSIHVVGNTIVDAVYENSKIAEESKILTKLGLNQNSYFLLTANRALNVDNEQTLK